MKKYKLLGGLPGLISGVILLAACAAFWGFIFNLKEADNAGEGIELAFIIIFIFPASVFNAIIALVITGLSIGILAGKSVNKGVYISAGVFGIIVAITVGLSSIMLINHLAYFLLFIAAAIVSVVAAIITFVAISKLLKTIGEDKKEQ